MAEIMQNIEEASRRLREPYDTIQELIHRLAVLNRLLWGMDQKLSPAMKSAIKFPMEALVANELLANDDINVKISLGCCICEVARITAPEPPYQDNIMREVFNLLITILESLSFVTGNAYTKAALVLENVAGCQLFMAMWDCDDAYISKMFHTFFHLRGTNHLNSVISDMKYIITLAIKEDADVPNDLFTILLHTLKRENRNVYPVSYKLAEKVLQDCASELKHCLLKAMTPDADLQNYSEIVKRVLSDAGNPVEDVGIGECSPSTSAPSEFNMSGHITRTDDSMKNDFPMKTAQSFESMQQGVVELDYASKDRDGKSDRGSKSESLTSQKDGEFLKNVIQEELVSEQVSSFKNPSLTKESLKHNSSTNMLRVCDQIRQENVTDTTCSQRKDSNAVKIVFEISTTDEVSASKELHESGLKNSNVSSSVRESLDSQIVTTSRKRGRRPNSLIKPEEGYGIHGATGSSNVPRGRRNKRKEIGSSSEGSISKKKSSTSRMAVETPLGVQNQSVPKKIRSKKEKPRDAGDISNDNGNLQASTISTRTIMRNTSKTEDETCPDHNIQSESNGCKRSPLHRDGSSALGVVKKQRSGSTSDHNGKKSLLKILASLETPEEPSEFDKVIEAIKAKTKKKRTHPKEDGSTLAESIKDNDDRLVGHEIKVYWPLDETFYTGSVVSFDVLTKTHKVIYDDGVEEVLDLSIEKWGLIGDDISSDHEERKGADGVMLPDTSTNAAGSSLPLINTHKVLKDAGGDHASTHGQHKVLNRSKSKKFSCQRQKARKRRSKLEQHPKNASGEHALNSSDKGQKSIKSRIKLDQASEDFGQGQMLNSNDQILEFLKNRSKSDHGEARDIINPATINSPSSKLQGRTRSKRTQEKLQKSPVTPSHSGPIQVGAGSSGTVNLHGYQVKCSTAPILDAIVSKYGDIAANCLYKSPSFRASLLEVVCNVVQRLRDPVITAPDIQSMISEISDAENAKIDVSWLQKYLEEIAKEDEAARKTSDVRMSTCLIIEATERDVKQRQAELVVVQTNFKEAEKRFEVLKHVLGRIDSGILESVAKEKSWHRRLDELLIPK